jgi:hypothetical protein
MKRLRHLLPITLGLSLGLSSCGLTGLFASPKPEPAPTTDTPPAEKPFLTEDEAETWGGLATTLGAFLGPTGIAVGSGVAGLLALLAGKKALQKKSGAPPSVPPSP